MGQKRGIEQGNNIKGLSLQNYMVLICQSEDNQQDLPSKGKQIHTKVFSCVWYVAKKMSQWRLGPYNMDSFKICPSIKRVVGDWS